MSRVPTEGLDNETPTLPVGVRRQEFRKETLGHGGDGRVNVPGLSTPAETVAVTMSLVICRNYGRDRQG